MQRAGESTDVGVSQRAGRLSPVAVFAALMAVIAAVTVTVLLTRDKSSPPPPRPLEQANFALTDTEAIARFKELNGLLLQSYRSRDLSLVNSYLTNDSPLRSRAIREITQLLKDRVIGKARFQTLDDRVLQNDSDAIVVRHKSVEYPHFVSEGGEDVSSSHRPVLQVVDWTMHLEGSTWKLFNSSPVRSKLYGGLDD